MSGLKKYLEISKENLGIKAKDIDFTKLTSVSIPKSSEYGIPVLNKQGYVRISDNEYTKMFVENAKNSEGPLLEIGCAYGHDVYKILENNGVITACDMDEKHLEILVRECPKDFLDNLYVYPAKFPGDINFADETFNAVFASRVLHFLDGETIEIGLKKIHKWLKPNGRFYFTALSVYKNYLKDFFLSKYKENIEKNIRWAGEISNQLEYAPEHFSQAPEFVQVFDIPQLEKILPEFGFKIEKISLFDYPDDKKSNNKGHIGFVAQKV